MVLDSSRRRLLAAAGLSAVGGLSTLVGIGSIETWTPEPGTWPLDRYGLRNSAANRSGTPPTDPTVAWRATPVAQVESIVVGPELLFVGGPYDGGRPGIAALRRRDGSVVWTADTGGSSLALRNGTLYAGAWWDSNPALVALDVSSGEVRWRVDGKIAGILVADDTVFAGAEYELKALDSESGRVRWTKDGGRFSTPAVASGSLFGSVGDVRRFRSRRVSDVATLGPPPTEWRSDIYLDGTPPVVAEGRVVVGTGFQFHSDTPGVVGLNAATGEREWTAFSPSDYDHVIAVELLTVLDDTVFFSFQHEGEWDREYALVACSLTDGEELWRHESSNWVSAVAAAGDTVFAGTGGDLDGSSKKSNRLFAFAPDGTRRWSVELEGGVGGFAAVDDTVFVGTADYDKSGRSGVGTALR